MKFHRLMVSWFVLVLVSSGFVHAGTGGDAADDNRFEALSGESGAVDVGPWAAARRFLEEIAPYHNLTQDTKDCLINCLSTHQDGVEYRGQAMTALRLLASQPIDAVVFAHALDEWDFPSIRLLKSAFIHIVHAFMRVPYRTALGMSFEDIVRTAIISWR